MFGIGPHITIACKVGAQVVKRLPSKEDGAIGRRLEELPDHRLQVVHNFRSFCEIADNSIQGHLVQSRISMLGYKVHMC